MSLNIRGNEALAPWVTWTSSETKNGEPMPTTLEITNTAKKLTTNPELKKYLKKGNQTFCNFFVRDFGADLFGTPLVELAGRAKQQTQNMATSARWTALGFKSAADDAARQAVFDKAQQLANSGVFVVAGARAPVEDPTYSGHVAVIVPSEEKDGGLVSSGSWGLRCPLIAHAGSKVFRHRGLNFGFGSKYKVNRLELFAFQTQEPAPVPAVFLGGFELQVGDNDDQQRWGGQIRSHSGSYVEDLQTLLNTLGFAIVGTADGDFGPRTEWAVREFQIYASAPGGAKVMDAAAAMPHERLEAIPDVGGDRYTGTIDGAANADTRTQLEVWKEGERRCPVVLTAFERAFSAPRGTTIEEDNLWNKDDSSLNKAHVHALDFSGLFDIPNGEKDADGYVLAGKYTPSLEKGMLAQPISNHNWDGLEVLPTNLVGKDTDDLTESERQTFRIIRAVSEVECMGYFDCLNAYDRGLMSAGLFHWTIGLTNRKASVKRVDAGELGAYASYLKAGSASLQAGFQSTFERFGLDVAKDWDGDGKKLFVQNARKFVSYCKVSTAGGKTKTLRTRKQSEYFATWHWFYRFLMSSRTSEGFQRGMWDFCRIRVREILTAPLRSNAGVDPVPITGGGTREALLGDVFASEKSAAILLRCHVNSPGHIVSRGVASSHISKVIEAVRTADPSLVNGSPDTWTNDAETALIQQLLDRANSKFPQTIRDTVDQVASWPNDRRADLEAKFSLKSPDTLADELSEERNFLRDEAGLPASPAPAAKQHAAIQIIPPLLGSDDQELGVCLIPKDDGSGLLDSILLQFGDEPEPIPDSPLPGDPGADVDPPATGAAAPPADLAPTPQMLPSIQIPVQESDPVNFTTDSGGTTAVQTEDGSVQYFELQTPQDGNPPKSFRVKLDLTALLGTPAGIGVTAELKAKELTYAAGIPTGGTFVIEVRLSGKVLPQDIVWSLAAAGNLAPGNVNLQKLKRTEDGSLQFPISKSGATGELPVPASTVGYQLSGDVTVGPGEVNRYRLRFDGRLQGDMVVNLGSSLAQFYAKSEIGIELDTDDVLELRFPGDQTVMGVRLDLFQEFRAAVVNNQWKGGTGKTHLIEIERNLGGYSDLTIRWRNRLPVIPVSLLSRVLNRVSQAITDTGRGLQSLVGNLPVRQTSTRVTFDKCAGGFVQTNLLPEATAVAEYDFTADVTAGNWRLHSTWVAAEENSDVAPIELSVGDALFVGSVDQQLPPAADVVNGGSDFQHITLFDAKTGDPVDEVTIAASQTVKVRITNAAALKVVADGVLLSSGATNKVIDDAAATRTGEWTEISSSGHGSQFHVADPAPLDDEVKLSLCLIAKIKGDDGSSIFSAEGRFSFPVGQRNSEGDLSFNAKSFACGVESTLKVLNQDHVTSFAGLISLGIPKNTVFRFLAAPGRNEFQYLPADSAAADAAKIRLRVPATNGNIFEPESERFTFELDDFRLHSGGTDVRGRVLTEEVGLGLQSSTALKKPLSVKGPKPPPEKPKEFQIGEVAFQDSRLIFAQVQAAAEISYFDDGRGTFTLTVAEKDVENWDIIADLTLTGSKEFHVDQLFTTFQITAFQFSTTYNTGSDEWSSDGSISGSIRFEPPEGKSSGSTGALSDLFGSGVTVRFEDWNPLDLADNFTFTIEVQPRTFEVASVLGVTLNGIEVRTENALPKGFKLLGDVTMKNLPGIDAELTFGGITLTPKLPVPEFTIDRIGASLSIPGSFKATGLFEHVKSDIEDGFKGEFSLDTEVLPPIDGVVQLTALKPLQGGGRVPSAAIYLQAGALEVPLFAGFYLRSLGFGLGLNRGLRGLMPEPPPAPRRTIQQRLLSVVDNPSGLPSPSRLDSWQPAQPKTRTSAPKWMFVASGLITFGKFPSDKQHTLSGSALLSLNHEGEVFLGVNLWLFTSPDETRQSEFQQRPAARGGILLSPKERILFGKFRTVKNPAISPKAPELLSEVLSAVETSMLFQADPNGFLLEVGWPWETRIKKSIGPLDGELTSGFRFGIYRGIVSFGLNWAIRMELKAEKKIGFSTWIGRAEAAFKVHGEGHLRISFVGALDHGFKPYLLGDVRLSATVKLEVSAQCRLSKKIGFIKIRLRISFRKSLELSISAALTMAMDPKPDLGARGTARVSVCVGRFKIGGNVDFVFNGDQIDKVQEKIKSLLPPPLPNSTTEFASEMLSAQTLVLAADESVDEWTYFFRRFTDENGIRRVRVVLFPSPGFEYKLKDEAATHRFRLKLSAEAQFRTFVASEIRPTEPADREIAWGEQVSHVVRSREDLLAGSLEGNESDPSSADINDLTLEDILESINGQKVEGIHGAKEVVDERPWNPSPEYSDDPAAELGERDHHSPDLRADTEYDGKVALASGEQDALQTSEEHPDNADGMAPGMLLYELVDLMQDGSEPKKEKYELAPYLHLALEFADPLEENKKGDPVKRLLADGDVWFVNDEPATLRAIYNTDGNTDDLPEYDLVTAPAAQADDRICLNWELWRESIDGEAVSRANRDMDVHYAELTEYRVTRRIVGDTDEPLRKVLQPGFLDPDRETQGNNSESLQLIRPQFQFVDQELKTVREGDILIYEVEAWSTDRELARTAITVQRRTIKVLPPLPQSQVLSVVQSESLSKPIRLRFTVMAKDYNEQAREILGDTGVEEFDLKGEHLQLRYKVVPASTQGHYGRSPGRIGDSRWSAGVKQRSEKITGFDIEFADPAQKSSIPWPDAKPVPDGIVAWQPIQSRIPPSEDRQLEGFVFQTDHAGLLSRIATTDPEVIEPGVALEFFVGVDLATSLQGEPMQRSPLVRCRTSVGGSLPDDNTFPPTNLGDLNGDSEVDAITPQGRFLQKEMTRGATVDALETVPPPVSNREFLDPRLISATIDYGSEASNLADPAAKTPRQPNDIVMHLAWPHDDSLTARWVDDEATVLKRETFDPVVEYRIHRTDLLDVDIYPTAKDGSLPAAPALSVSAVSETEYRARPGSVLVTGLRDGLDENKKRFIEKDWNKVDDGSFTAGLTLNNSLDYIEKGDRVLSVSMPLHLATDLKLVCKAIAEELDDGSQVVVQCRPSFPVLPNVFREVNENDSLKTRFDLFSQGFDSKNDPYGWNAAEAFGMSCECTFLRANGTTIHAEDIRKLVDAGTVDLLRVTPVFFQADDGETLLNVVRLTMNREAAIVAEGSGAATTLDIRAALLLQLSALPANVTSQTSAEMTAARNGLSSALGDTLKGFLDDVNFRLSHGGIADATAVDQHYLVLASQRPNLSTTQEKSNRGLATLRIPVRSNQPLGCRLPVSDRWGHEYSVAIEVVRRYDAVRQLVQPSDSPSLRRAEKVPRVSQRSVSVSRSRALGDLNLFATALPGAVQAALFRHVASFAATSNAEQKARGQYAPLVIYLERVIANQVAVETILRGIPGRVSTTPDPVAIWAAYHQWLTDSGHLDNATDLPLIVERGEQTDKLHLTIPPVAQHGLYGADRYVYPDVPPGYEYRVCAQARAGRVRSNVCRTGFVAPMFDAKEDYPEQADPLPRMQPRAYTPTAANQPHEKPFSKIGYTTNGSSSSLTLKMPLVFQRFHLRPEIRPLWVDAEQPLDGIADLGFGSFPDLNVKYRVLLLENYLAVKDDPAAIKVLVPLFEITTPDLSLADTSAEWFGLDGLPAGIEWTNKVGDKVAIEQADGSDTSIDPAMNGAFLFNIELALKEPQAGGYTTVLQSAAADGAVQQVLFLTVSREGKVSDLSVNEQVPAVF